MDESQPPRLLPLTLLDAMVLSASCTVSAWLLASTKNDDYLHPFWPEGLGDWVVLTAYLQYGPTVAGPFLVALQYICGRRGRLMPGEVAWIIIGLELLPFAVLVAFDPNFGPSFDWYLDWLFLGSPPFVIVCTFGALAWHIWSGRPRHWSHRLGLGICLAQCVPSALLIVGWIA